MRKTDEQVLYKIEMWKIELNDAVDKVMRLVLESVISELKWTLGK